jgi:hypothetical protein
LCRIEYHSTSQGLDSELIDELESLVELLDESELELKLLEDELEVLSVALVLWLERELRVAELDELEVLSVTSVCVDSEAELSLRLL